mmetsp:Transcript_21416/g.60319  ORF Transcript_21416/g.60319 Transcript_21416/m.60319 type:complete len:323 (+) Transcript_21416:58-1026(+)|eukprot:CAMPEP_0119132760 /NCGR_PEP_ID=MMETSP1310-20130426/12263_1 /TAXON_ID=464262 /ORGANISM="Genus nov. species nov., Strain RCC2339" /LENGTH=322 /DNA_ID=CAMNT_0007123413 /DNA_START=54 /DNA_END=1022 /DNA_ORIENTATION=-
MEALWWLLGVAIEWVLYAGGVLFLLNFLTFLVPFLVHTYVFKAQDLKKKYGAKWALVTGGSSGIGRAIVEKLASQGVNVVIAALDDDFLRTLDVQSQYPELEFRKVPVDLSSDGALETIAKATEDLDISLVFNNAGYIQICMFAYTPLERQMKNIKVNATVAVQITHHFVTRMIEKNLKGCVVFTSSPAGMMPCPFSAVYGCTKAFITEFAVSLAGEVRHHGIDVLVAHPSPVDTRFYAAPSADDSSSLAMFKKTAAPPTLLCDYMFRTVGRGTCVVNQGYFAFWQTVLFKILDASFFAALLQHLAWTTDEFKTLTAKYKKE